MAVVKNMSTENSRAFWIHVESIAAQRREKTEQAAGNDRYGTNEISRDRVRIIPTDPRVAEPEE